MRSRDIIRRDAILLPLNDAVLRRLKLEEQLGKARRPGQRAELEARLLGARCEEEGLRLAYRAACELCSATP